MAENGQGTYVTFAGTSQVFQLTSVQGQGNFQVGKLDATHLATTGTFRQYIMQEKKTPGSFAIEGHHGSTISPTVGTSETITIGWGTTSASDWVFPGALAEYSPSATIDEVMTFSGVIEILGDIATS